MYKNPFDIRWNKSWSFTFFLEGGLGRIKASGLGLTIIKEINPGESLLESADEMILKEEIRRKSIYYSWLKSIN